ncbi:Fc.00g085280.m01.CDS01 [Cosmosporella sp. VM-42]
MEPDTGESSNFPPRVKQPLDGYHRQLREQNQADGTDARPYVPSKGSFSIPHRANLWRMRNPSESSGSSSYRNITSFFDSERLASAEVQDDSRRPNQNATIPQMTRWPFLGSIRSRASSTVSRTPPQVPPKSPPPESEGTLTEEIRLPWRPFFLHRRVLAGFAILLAILIAALEVVLFISDRNDGLRKSNDAARYLWQYGTTLVFVIVAMVWARVEYQAKSSAPWIRMSKESANADKSLLLDYVSMPDIWAVVKAVQNKDFLVAGSVAAGILLKVVIVLATAFITPTVIRASNDRIDITLGATFSKNNTGLTSVGSLPYLTMAALQTTNLSYPSGISPRAAYQPFTIANWDTAILNTTVDGFVGSMACQSADLLLGGVRFTGESRIQLNLTASTNDCTTSQIIQTTKFAAESILAKRFIGFQAGSCDGSTDSDDQRIVVVSGRVTLETDAVQGTKKTSNIGLDGKLLESAALICSPNYVITRMNLAKNATDLISIKLVSNAANSTIDGIHPWDIARAQFKSFNNHRQADTSSFIAARGFYENETILDADEPTYAALAMRAKESGSTPRLDDLRDGVFLEDLAQAFYGQYSALVARFAMMDEALTSSTATADMIQRRLIARQIPTHIMAALLGICFFMTVAAIFLAPKHGFLPRDPGSIVDTATLLAHNRALLQCLQGAGGVHNGAIRERLAGSSYSTGVKGYDNGESSNLGYFHVFGGNAPTKTYPSRINQTGWRQPVALTGLIRLLFALILASVIIGFEVSLRASDRENGLRNIGDDTAYIAWTAIPAMLLLFMAMYVDAVDSWTRIIAPFTNLYYQSEFSDSMGLNLIDQWKLVAWWKGLKMRDFDVMATVSGILFASLLVVATAALFEPVSVDNKTGVALGSEDFFANRLAFSDDDPICTDCTNDTAIASLILNANASYPPFTFEDLNLQSVSVDGLGLANELQVAVKLPAIRSNMTCRLYLFDEISSNVTVGNTLDDITNPLRVDLAGEPCRRRTEQRNNNVIISTGSSGQSASSLGDNPFFGVAVGRTNTSAQCSDWLYIWGQLANANSDDISVKSISALACNESIVAIDANVVLHGADLRIDEADPPVPDGKTVQKTSVAIPQLDYALLANTTTSDLLDQFFAILSTSRFKISTTLLGDSSQDAADEVQSAILRQHSIIRAQSLNFKSRRHLSSGGRFPSANGTLIMSGLDSRASVSEALPTFNGNIVTQQIRLRQDTVATRILQSLLGVVLVFHILSWIFTPKTILPRWPTSIASVAALLADGNVLPLLPRVAEWQSKRELEEVFRNGSEAMRFEMGWEPPPRQTKWDKRPRKEYGAFGIRAIRIEETGGDVMGLQPLGLQPPGPHPLGVQPIESQMVGSQNMGSHMMGPQTMGSRQMGIRRVASSTVASDVIHEEESYQESYRQPTRPEYVRKGSAHGSAKNWWA